MPFSVSTDLIEAARSGDVEPIERLVEAVWPDAYRLARAIVGDPQGAQDAAQDASIALYRTIASLRSAQAFHVWFYRIVVRHASAVRRRTVRERPPLDAVPPEFADHAASLDVRRALESLSPPLRDAVVLHYMEDLSSREIGVVLGVPSPTVRFRLMIARRRLRALLDHNPAPDHSAVSEVRTHAY